jgi:hypothetical protein
VDDMVEEAARAICWASNEPVDGECRSDCMNAKRCCGKPPECCYRDARAVIPLIVERCAKVADAEAERTAGFSRDNPLVGAPGSSRNIARNIRNLTPRNP